MARATELLSMFESNLYKGQLVIVDPAEGNMAGLGTVTLVKGDMAVVKNKKSGKSKAFSSYQVMDVADAPLNWYTKDTEKYRKKKK